MQLGCVSIGRNEGERLRRCLESVRLGTPNIVYVDSGSSDGSIDVARALGCDVVLSEDLAHDKDYAGVRVENPFAGS